MNIFAMDPSNDYALDLVDVLALTEADADAFQQAWVDGCCDFDDCEGE